MRELHGKVAVVTGGASGIGRALAEAFCRERMHVVIGDVEEPALQQAVNCLAKQGASITGVAADVSRAADVEGLRDHALSAFGAVHVVCNNAGIATAGTVDGTPPERWRWTLDVNLWGVIHGCRTFLPLLLEQRQGHIVNTASIAALAGHANLGAYTASKYAVAGLSECLHHELAAAGSPVRVSLFCPGLVQTSIRNSERNRPAHVPPASPWPGTTQAGPTAAAANPPELPAAQAAAAVLQGIRDERFWIFTHPEMTRQEIEARTAWMLDDANTATQTNHADAEKPH
ncbi:MAG: SDR family NAD(P)-dependent oxidoreductase [Streptosporangiaceae bacterium]